MNNSIEQGSKTNRDQVTPPIISGDIPRRVLRLMNFGMVKRDFLKEVRANRAYTTFKTYQSMCNRYERWLADEGHPDVDVEYALDAQTLTRYKYSLGTNGIKKQGGLLGQSVRGAMGPLKSLCTYLIRMGMMDKDSNPFSKIELPKKVDPVRLRVSDAEVETLMRATENQRDPKKVALSRLVLSTLIHAGVRANEFQNIEIEHINVQHETLEVRYGKGGKTRLLHPPREFWTALKGWLPFRNRMNCEHPYLFALGPRRRMNDESLRNHLEEIKAIAGLKDHNNIHPHRLRGWFASHMHQNGATVPQVQKALGHSDARTTFAYLYNNDNGAKAMKDCASFGPIGWGASVETDAEHHTPSSAADTPAGNGNRGLRRRNDIRKNMNRRDSDPRRRAF